MTVLPEVPIASLYIGRDNYGTVTILVGSKKRCSDFNYKRYFLLGVRLVQPILLGVGVI
jgi:hypothetical protein